MLKLYLKVSLEKLVSENKCQNTQYPRRNVVVVQGIMGLVVSDAAGAFPLISTPILSDWREKGE